MAKYVLKHRGGELPQEGVALIEAAEGVTVCDRMAGALLIDASEEAARDLRERLPDWVLTPETTFAPPEPVKRRARE